jgi:hypothetical protein
MVSLAASGRVTARLALPAMLYWSLVPALQAAGLAAALRRWPDAKLLDDYFSGFSAWLFWVAGFAALWTFAPADFALGHTQYPLLWYVTGALASLWSLKTDYAFFQRVGGVGWAEAAGDVVVQRLVCWPLGVAIFVGPAAWQLVAAGLGL